MHAHQRRDRRAGGEILAYRRLLQAHHAIERRDDHGIAELLAGQIELRAPLRDHGLAVAHFLDRVLVASFGDLEGGFSGVELSAGDQLLLRELDAAIASEPRVVHHRARLTDDRGLLRIDFFVGASRREPEARARLLQRCLGLLDTQLEVALVEPADELPLLYARAEVDRGFGKTAGDLGAEDHLIVGGQRSGRRHRARDRALRRRRHFHFTRRRAGGLALLLFGADRALALAAAQQEAETESEGGQNIRGHPADDTPTESPARPL